MGESTTPPPLAWAGGACLEDWIEARAVPPPWRGQEMLALRPPARTDKGPSQGSHKRFIIGGGISLQDSGGGTSMERLWGLLQGAVRLSGVWGHLRPPVQALAPSQKPQGWPLPFPLQSLPSTLTLRTLFLALCSYGTPKSLTLFLPGLSLPLILLSPISCPPDPHRKGCPHDPLRPSTSMWKAPSRHAQRKKRKRRKKWPSHQATSIPWS